MNNESMEELIKEEYNNLSKGKQKVAKYVLGSLKKVSYSTITQLKGEVGVSETTIIRFAHALGFNSFSQMQQAIQSDILYRENKASPTTQNNSFHNKENNSILQQDINILNDMMNNLDTDSLDKAAHLITKAKKVLVIGHHTAYASAYWFASTLGLMLPHIQLLDEKNIYNELLNVDENTVIIAITFPRYRKSTYNVVEKVREKHGEVIAISDSELSPVCRLANVYLLTTTNRDVSGYNSISSVISLLNLLVVNVRKLNQEQVKKRLVELEKYYEEDDELFE